MQRLTERLEVRISQADRDQAQAVGRGLGMNFSGFVRMALKERTALEQALNRADDEKDGGHK